MCSLNACSNVKSLNSNTNNTSSKIVLDTLSAKAKKNSVTVALDYYFNCEWKKLPSGDSTRFHYTWEDKKDSGFSLWDSVFKALGAQTISIVTAPNESILKNVKVYIIVDPDTKKESYQPVFINEQAIEKIKSWVFNGGTLVLMANDSGNCEFVYLNQLAINFGITFQENSLNRVKNNQFETGGIAIPENHKIFSGIHKIFVKEYASLLVHKPAEVLLTKANNNVMAVSHYGKGKVFAIGDPWLYNEYVNRKRITPDFENLEAAEKLSKWLIESNSSINKN